VLNFLDFGKKAQVSKLAFSAAYLGFQRPIKQGLCLLLKNVFLPITPSGFLELNYPPLKNSIKERVKSYPKFQSFR